MNEELKRCPYCKTGFSEDAPDGVKLIEKEIRPGEPDPVIAYQVVCTGCKARGPRMASRAAAARYWNRGK